MHYLNLLFIVKLPWLSSIFQIGDISTVDISASSADISTKLRGNHKKGPFITLLKFENTAGCVYEM